MVVLLGVRGGAYALGGCGCWETGEIGGAFTGGLKIMEVGWDGGARGQLWNQLLCKGGVCECVCVRQRG